MGPMACFSLSDTSSLRANSWRVRRNSSPKSSQLVLEPLPYTLGQEQSGSQCSQQCYTQGRASMPQRWFGWKKGLRPVGHIFLGLYLSSRWLGATEMLLHLRRQLSDCKLGKGEPYVLGVSSCSVGMGQGSIQMPHSHCSYKTQ